MPVHIDSSIVQPRPLRILYLVHRVPYPPNRGDRIRSYNILKQLANRHEVSLACLADEPLADGTEQELSRLCSEHAIVTQRSSRWLRGGLSLATGKSITEGMFRSEKLASIVRQWSRTKPFDVVLVFCSSMAQYQGIPELEGIPAIVDLVDVDSQKWLEYAHTASPARKWIYRTEGQRILKLEARLAKECEAITLVSEAEAELFRGLVPNQRTHAISNGVDTQFFSPFEHSGETGHCVFVGALDYRANIQGIEWFCHKVLPDLRHACPDFKLSIVGRAPTPQVQKLNELAGVTVVGSVPDVRPYVESAQVVIAPLQVARGLQNKVLEAFAMQRPVVTTPQALEGIEATPGIHAVVASSPQEWTSSLTALYTDQTDSAQIAAAARQLVVENYSWSARLEVLSDLIEQCCRSNQQTNSSVSECTLV